MHIIVYVHKHLGIGYFKARGVKKDSIPEMIQIELSNIPVKIWTVYLDVDCLQMLVRPKDQDPKEKKSGVIYSYQCGAIDCGEEYIGETSRTLGEWYKGHLREPSPIQAYSQLTGHQLSPDIFNILGRRPRTLSG